MRYSVGVYDVEGPPVPIPNTVVKLNGADNTWLEATREDRTTPTQKATAQQGGCFILYNDFRYFFLITSLRTGGQRDTEYCGKMR